MLEIKPLTSADHFVRPVQRVAAMDHLGPQHPPASVVVTISPEAAALGAASQAQSAPSALRGEALDKAFRRRLREILAGGLEPT